MGSHITTCLWIFFTGFTGPGDDADPYAGTWIDDLKKSGMSNEKIYMTSLYWVMTTLSTVGYGDISISNNGERVFCMLLMVIGTVSFSYINGTIFS